MHTIILNLLVLDLLLGLVISIIFLLNWFILFWLFLFAGHYTFKLYATHINTYISACFYIFCANLYSPIGEDTTIVSTPVYSFLNLEVSPVLQNGLEKEDLLSTFSEQNSQNAHYLLYTKFDIDCISDS